MGDIVFSITSGYGANTRQPFVGVELHSEYVQMSVESARELALNLLQAAEAAQSDQFIVDFFIQNVGVSFDEAALLLIEFRQYRDGETDGT